MTAEHPAGRVNKVRALRRRARRNRAIALALDTQRRYNADRASALSATITYNAFLSLFPILLLGLSLIGFILTDPAERAHWADKLAGSIPGLGPLVAKNLGAIARDRAAVGIIGLVSLAWTGTNVVRAAGTALNVVFEVPEHSGLKSRLLALGSLGSLGSLALASVAAAGIVGALRGANPVFLVLAFVVTLGMDFLLFLVSYRLLTHRRGPPFRDLWPGALLAAVGWSLLKAVGVWYATRTVANAEAVYGTFAATVGVLVILSLGARIFLYGAELDVVLLERKRGASARKAISLKRHREMRRRASG